MKSIILSFFSLSLLTSLSSAACDDKWSVQLQDSNTPLSNDFDATISGSGGPYKIDISGNAGTVTQGSRVTNVVVDYQIPWQQGGEGSETTNLYAFIGADSEGLMMGWAYCHGETLTDVWLESTTGSSDFTNPKITGTCSVSSDSKDVALTTSSQCYEIDLPDNYPSIKAKGLILNNGDTGTVILAGNSYSLLPFANIDCTTCKDSAYPGGWYETHAVMKSAANVCMGIFYLPVTQTDTIKLNYVNCFAQQIGNTDFTGTYTLDAPKVVASSSTAAAATTTSSSSTNASGAATSAASSASATSSGSITDSSSSTMATSMSSAGGGGSGTTSGTSTPSSTDSGSGASVSPTTSSGSSSTTTSASTTGEASSISSSNSILVAMILIALALFQ